MSLVLGLKMNELAAVIFGAAGFAISVVTLVRSIRTDQRSRRVALEQKRFAYRAACIEAKTALQMDLRTLRSVSFDAAVHGATHLSEGVGHQVALTLDSIGHVDALLAETSKQLPPQQEWNRLESILAEGQLILATLNVDLRTQETATLIDECRRHLELHKRVEPPA